MLYEKIPPGDSGLLKPTPLQYKENRVRVGEKAWLGVILSKGLTEGRLVKGSPRVEGENPGPFNCRSS